MRVSDPAHYITIRRARAGNVLLVLIKRWGVARPRREDQQNAQGAAAIVALAPAACVTDNARVPLWDSSAD